MMKKINYHIGLDDTDHLEVGCTTEKMNDFLNFLNIKLNITILELKLVRLWPFASRRTRGNAALSGIIEIDTKDEKKFLKLCKQWFDDLLNETLNHPESNYCASPALIISRSQFPKIFYSETVKGHVFLENRISDIEELNCTVHSHESKWGIIGASAAIAWSPNESSTLELISWRKNSMIGKMRLLNLEKINKLDLKYPGTFLNRDPSKNHPLISPRTPCPVLYGIRGKSIQELNEAHAWLQSDDLFEKCQDYKIHKTNQLTDDHTNLSHGTVLTTPLIIKGAHSSITVFSNNDNLTLVAFSEGGPVNKLLRLLMPGDRICWTGLTCPDDGSIHVEKLSLFDSVPRISSRPKCCSRSMKSAGNNQKLRCIVCGKEVTKHWLSDIVDLSGIMMINNWVEPNPSNRRHLAKPLDFGIPIQ